jgi:predicted permease
VRGLIVEGLLLSTVGAALGVLLAYAGVQVIRGWLPTGIPRVASIGIDMRVLLATVAAAMASGIFFGLVPALHASRPDLVASLKDSGRSSTAGAATQRLRGALVVAEVALAVMLLVGAGLFIGSFIKLITIDPGFDYHNVLVLNVSPPTGSGRFDFEAARKASLSYVPRVVEAVRTVPGVAELGVVSGGVPLTGSWSRNSVTIAGRELKGDDDSLDLRNVSAEYLKVLRIPLRRGRHIEPTDTESSPPVIVLNEAGAKKYWPGEDAIGKRIAVNKVERTVVGIVGDIRHLGPETPPRQEGYIPFPQGTNIGGTLVMRTAGDPLQSLAAVKAAIWSVNKAQRLTSETVTLEGYMDRLIAQRRFNMALLALFGILGLVIAAVGIYGVMAYIVAQRTNEIGVRMALGATRRTIVAMVLRRAGVLMALGLLLGSVGAYYFSVTPRLGLNTYLFETKPTDVWIFAAALGTLGLAGFVASAIPARRAASVDPLVALRHE